VPKKCPPEFERDVVRVARRGDLSQAEVAADFDISVESVRRGCRQADIDDGVSDGQTSAVQSELVQLCRKARRLQMEDEILRRAAAAGLRGSMGRVASARDNAAMESWRCCRRTSWTAASGAPATSCTRRSCCGSSTPTTAPSRASARQGSPRRVRTRLHHSGRNRGMITTHAVSTEPAAIPLRAWRASATTTPPSTRPNTR
jgi:transposase